MNEEKLLYRMALTMVPDIGARTAKKLIAYMGSAEAVFKENHARLQRIPGIGFHLAARIKTEGILRRAELEIREMEKQGISCLYYEDSDYPPMLTHCTDGPVLFFYRGKNIFTGARYLSVVGTRRATPYGRDACRTIIADLSARYPDLVIVSGLAYGIDITAHRAALDYGLDTIAVLAHGLNTLYPYAHRDAARRIMDQGALVSDFHTTVKVERNNFLRRNRIIAGLSNATFVVESASSGGSLITAEMASSYGREILALPGRSSDKFSAGCNHIIKKNMAALVESAKDIVLELNWEDNEPEQEALATLDNIIPEAERKVMETIRDNYPAGPELISNKTGIPIDDLVSMLLLLELKNWISAQPGSTYKLVVKLPE